MRQEIAPYIAAQLQTETGASQVVGLLENEELAQLAESGKNLQSISQANAVVVGINALLLKAGVLNGK
jgi:hypothetical protein